MAKKIGTKTKDKIEPKKKVEISDLAIKLIAEAREKGSASFDCVNTHNRLILTKGENGKLSLMATGPNGAYPWSKYPEEDSAQMVKTECTIEILVSAALRAHNGE